MTADLEQKPEQSTPDAAVLAVESPPLPPATAEGASLHRSVIEPAKGWQLINIRELWQYRELLFFLAWRDVKVRYKQTVLGAAWVILQPLMTTVVFTIFFSRMGKMSSGDLPYPIFVLSGFMPWFFFSSAVSHAGNSVIGSERLISKIYFPRLAVPFATIGAAVLDFCVALSLIFILMLGYGVAPSWNIVFAPLIFALIAIMATGLGTLLAALNVTYRDIRYVIPFFLQMGLFVTPTIYMVPDGSESPLFRALLIANPMTSLVSSFRACLLGGEIPWLGLAIAAVASFAALALGCLYFRKVEDRFADII